METVMDHAVYTTGTVSAREYEECRRFKQLQHNFVAQFEQVFPDKMAAKTVIIIPSLTLDPEILEKVQGANYYEERLLCLLMLLRMPHTNVVYVTSMPIDPVIVDYYLHLLPGITGYHARQRLTLLSCFDTSSKSLTAKILERPRLIERIRAHIPADSAAHLACFNVTEAERELAVKLQLPIFGCDPDLLYLSSKSTGRKLFRTCGIDVPKGFEDIFTMPDLVEALVKLKHNDPKLSKAVLKINEGFSGEGNAIFSYSGAPSTPSLLHNWISKQLPLRLQIVADKLPFDEYIKKMQQMGGIVEEFIEAEVKQSPSVQCRINPLGVVEILSTHDQVLGGESNQVYLGATFPANIEYAPAIGEMGMLISEELRSYGVLGRFSVDFISVKKEDGWKHYAIEINLRKGGTTHPYLMLQFLTDGKYDNREGNYYTRNGQTRYYMCSDNVQSDQYKGLTPHDLIEISICNGLMYDGTSQEGVMFHLISALSQYGKLGLVCIGATPARAEELYRKTLEVLDMETVR